MSGLSDIEAVLERLHQWLDEFRAEADSLAQSGTNQQSQRDSPRQFGLIDLVEEFTALRQELKLQTKSTRGLQEQAEALLPPLRQATELFRSVVPREEQAAWTAGRPLAEGLATLDEALDRCRGEIEKAREIVTNESPRRLIRTLDELLESQSWLRRHLFRRYHQQVRETVGREAWDVHQEWLQSLLEGFGLIQNRLRRVMQAEAIERIDCLGRQVDPDRMIVIEVADAPDQPPHAVVEELRRGYTWKGRVLRLAEVRATRGRPDGNGSESSNDDNFREVHAVAEETPGEDGTQPGWLETE
jgi:molecular chaperone GrpE